MFGIKSSPDPVFRTLTHNFYVGTEEELLLRTGTRDMAFVVERLQAGLYMYMLLLLTHAYEDSRSSHASTIHQVFVTTKKSDIFLTDHT